MRTWQSQREAWQRIPVDEVGYFDAGTLAGLPYGQLLEIVRKMEHDRYGGWRNRDGLWREHMGLDSITGRRVLDYGCGLGIEALQYAKGGNAVAVADINLASVLLAERVLVLHGYDPVAAFKIGEEPPGRLPGARDGEFDLVVMNGVLHHIEDPYPAVREAHRVLAPRGELRVMVYTDAGWRRATETEPPADVTGHPRRGDFVRWGDAVGDWADWYNGQRLEVRFGEWFRLREWHYIADGQYGIGIMEKQ